MNFQHRKKSDELEINFIPLIDVLLVIIIFLIVSATFSRVNELQINLPTS
ncbi:MAG: biopolymer transporter ExbD, partial [Methylophilaceae bacterium]|nr:biopolymer transporter ExbD [Methylophilaceae bacterium]